ncbi:deoxyribose-phosphate aldolase [Alkaliphilus sp. MSJ-5]|uniref:Deoxyribose-phosphate aldolase n=1 Tax=Alkaliphilus flagellatus TaxID=2841507 RepID=A0ABS6G558_9FIRM|nr:deoxyribose-phosphate aldolase [Alkaliphilus flagellatus]MBU5677276.1 deoxyribose-phosphate aldolase [Alkaliphilus flagellatus]
MNIAKYIDHTLLKPETKKEEIKKICEEAREYGFFSVCVNGANVALAYEQLQGTDVKVTAVVGFPLGAMTSEAKAFETKNAIDNGAKEIDTVINIGALKEGKEEKVLNDIKAVVDAASGRAIVKVIIENCLLTNEEKILACKLAKKAGADFVKTSTGFSTGGATVEDVQLMRETVGPEIGVKASGGVRDLKTALAMIEAGATRIGASASVNIVKDYKGSVEGY